MLSRHIPEGKSRETFFSLWLRFCTAVIIVSINSACLNSPDKIGNCENNKSINIFHYGEFSFLFFFFYYHYIYY